MDSIYDNLENYNDANVIQELTNENNDLRNKLEEHATAMAKLQTDFDKLAADYKKLEINYSSLLKTARAEIERKSQVITNLNIEKDKMVLSTIQNRNMSSLRKNLSEPRRERDNIRKSETDTHARNKNKEISGDAKSRSSSRGRKETCRTPSEDSLNIEQTIKSKPVNIDKVYDKKEMSKGRNSNIKENVSQGYKEHKEERSLQSKALSIKSRRKSMPATRIQCKFSSDDEHEDSSSTIEANRKKLSRENATRKNYDRSCNDKQDNKRLGFNTFHNRSNRKYDNDRGRDSNGKYEYSHRHRRNLSPEKSRRKSPWNYPDERHLQYAYSRKRALESPPRSKHYHSRGNYDRDNIDFEINVPRPCDQERLAVKRDYEEPLIKRLRSNSFKLSEDENKQYGHKGPDHITTMTEAVQLFEHVSCQSPDYLLAESTTTQPIKDGGHEQRRPQQPSQQRWRVHACSVTDGEHAQRRMQQTMQRRPWQRRREHAFTNSSEWVPAGASSHELTGSGSTQSSIDQIAEIKNTATYPLEDPRENSKRYIITTENGMKVLSTIIGRNVDLKPINTSTWDMKEMKLPDALRKHPSQCNDDIVKEIYMDFDNPPSNLSIESGEILPFDQAASTGLSDINSPEHENINARHESKEELNKIFEISNYTIPKINENDNTKTYTVDDKHKNLTNTKTKVNIAGFSQHDNPENQITHEEKKKNISIPNVTECESKNPTITSREIVTTCQLTKLMSPINNNRDMVEGDLELSDETYDDTDIQRRVEKKEPVDVTAHVIKKNTNEINDHNIKEKDVMSNNKEHTRKEIKELFHKQEQAKVKTSGTTKKHKAKKKSHRHKSVEEPMEIQETGDDSVTNEAKEKVKLSKEVKNKFCDLFGDSSSLITPDDLGLPQPHVPTVLPSPKYLQIFEDAQDATVIAKTGEEKEEATKREDEGTEKNINIKQLKTKEKSDKSLEHKKKKSKKTVDSKSIALKIAENVDSTNKEIPNASSLTIDSNVVQTVIISTGVQPQASPTNLEPGRLLASLSTCHVNIDEELPITQNVDNCQTQHYSVQESRDTRLQALATSTPAKPQNCLQPVTCYDTPEGGNDSNEIRVNIEQITPVADEHSNSNTLESQTDADAPDVRIFIRRRRKGVKKAA